MPRHVNALLTVFSGEHIVPFLTQVVSNQSRMSGSSSTRRIFLFMSMIQDLKVLPIPFLTVNPM